MLVVLGAKVRRIIETTKFCTMKVVELLKIGGEMLKVMSEHDVMRDDYRYVPMVEEYQQMRHNRVKHVAAVRILAEEYNISSRTVERVIKRMRKEC